ncbi:MAG: hypothetical protein ACOWWR_18445 [Eubacteriales bacterium]
MNLEGITKAKERIEGTGSVTINVQETTGVAANYAKDPKNFKPDGKFAKGNKLNKPSKYSPKLPKQMLIEAIQHVEKDKSTTLLERFVHRAYANDKVLIALVKKIVPDITLSELANKDGEPLQIKIVRRVLKPSDRKRAEE